MGQESSPGQDGALDRRSVFHPGTVRPLVLHRPRHRQTPNSCRRVGKTASLRQQRAKANPFDAEWTAYFEGRDKKLVLALTPAIMAKVHRVQDGSCPGCGQVFEHGEDLRLVHRDGNRKNNRVANLDYYHPNCCAQRYIGTDSKTESSRPLDVCHA